MNEPGIVVVVVVVFVVLFEGRMLEVEVVFRFEVLIVVKLEVWECLKLLLVMRI